MEMSVTLYPQMRALLRSHPELDRYRRHLLKNCCRAATDAQIRTRVRAFLVLLPQFEPLLKHLLVEEPPAV